MQNQMLQLQTDPRTTQWLLELARAGVTPKDYRLVLSNPSFIDGVLDVLSERPRVIGTASAALRVQECDRDRSIEHEFVFQLYRRGLRHGYQLDPIMKDSEWMMTLIDCIKRPQAADRISA